MAKRRGTISEAELDFALSVTERSFDTASCGTRFTSLCLMAVIVARYPAGDAQDEAEDRLAAAVARAALNLDDLDVIRRFRADGLHGEVRCLGQNRPPGPTLGRHS